MIYFVVAIDEKRGMANDHGIPWQGKIPSDVKHYHDLIKGHDILMGLATYNEFAKPMPGQNNYVISDSDQPLRDGFIEVRDLDSFVKEHSKDLCIIGGAGVFAQTITQADELYLTRLDADFKCTKFFPEFEQDFKLAEQSDPITENGITFKFEKWVRR